MPTIRDVAKKSGVSTATVSYVLNNRAGTVSDETRSRVLAAIRELNYRPSALFHGRDAARGTETIGVIMPIQARGVLVEHPYFAHLLDGLLGATTERHWNTTLFTVADWKDAGRSLRVYCDGRVEGLVVIAGNDLIKPALLERGIPVVYVNAESEDPAVSSVDVDNVGAIRELVRHLVALGHRRIAHLGGELAADNARLRRRGYEEAMAEAGLPIPPGFLTDSPFTPKEAHAAALPLLALPPDRRPTALVCANDNMTRGAYAAVREAGLSVPGDVSVTGFDGMPFGETADPPLTTVRQPLQEIGVQAAQVLFRLISGEAARPEKVLLPTEIIERGSVAAPQATVAPSTP
jgi:LacI family transcriptional regulator